MTQQNALALAKQGDQRAIAYVVNYFLQDKSVKVRPTIEQAVTVSPVQADPFVLGTENALQASKLVQVAKTKAEWQQVADYWGSAVTFMQTVPASHPKYAIAQKKVLEYQANLD